MTQPKLKLYTYPHNKNAYKALIAAQYVGVDLDVPSDFQMGVTNKTPEFLKLNPNGKVKASIGPRCKPARMDCWCHHWQIAIHRPLASDSAAGDPKIYAGSRRAVHRLVGNPATVLLWAGLPLEAEVLKERSFSVKEVFSLFCAEDRYS
jgi:Glutathione S-transferase, N-terminal domain